MLLSSIVGLAPATALLCIGIVTVGAIFQGSVGVGMNLLGAPLLSLIDPDFIPAALLLAVIPLTIGMARRERGHIDRHGVAVAMIGRVPGTIAGASVAAVASTTTLQVIVGGGVLAAVVLSFSGLRFSPTDRNLVVAGLASGFSGTATGVGGPPMVLTYQHSDVGVLRATLAAFFTLGALIGAGALVVTDVLNGREVRLALLLLPGVAIGFAISRYTLARLPNHVARPLVLTACAASAIALLTDVAFG